MSGLLQGKNILIMGLRNKWSIAWGIAQAASREGANLIFSYLGEREKELVEKLAETIPGSMIINCDVTNDEQIENAFEEIRHKKGMLDGLVHSIAHAKSDDLAVDYVNTSRDGFAHAHNVSVFSLVSVAKKASELMKNGGSIITLTYLGSQKVIKNYNVMGVAKAALEASVRYLASDLGRSAIRVNAISAGPIKTLSAKGVKDFDSMLKVVEQKAPLRRCVTIEDIGNAATFLLSDMSQAITGEILFVDSGYNILGL